MTTTIKDQVKAALKKKGYKFREFKNTNKRAVFVAKYGYDPAILLNRTIRMTIDAPNNWQEMIPDAPEPRKVKKTKSKAVQIT